MGDANNRAEDMKGRVKEAAGDLTDNEELEREGKIDQTSAKAKDKADETIDKVKEKADEMVNR